MARNPRNHPRNHPRNPQNHESPQDPQLARLERLQQWRVRPDPDWSMGFLAKQFKQEIERPHKQLAAIVAIWEQLVPPALGQHCRLENLQRGVLHVAVSSSSHLYELDRLLRSGLEQQIITAHKGPAFRRVQLRVAEIR